MKRYLFPLILILSSCSFFISKIDEKQVTKASVAENISIVFSHNLSGETHPCGCRNFPLGGLPQVAGLFAKLSKDRKIIYVDTGDTFFPSSVVPASMKDSLTFAGENLALGLEQIGLNYYIPGDQDFAMGVEFLQSIANSRKFTFLIANLADPKSLKHQKFAVIENGKSKIFLTGLVHPEVFNGPQASLFSNPEIALNEVLEEIKNAGYEKNNSYHRLVVMSHAGIDLDEKLAQNYPFIDWIIGAHSQSFLRYSKDEGNVKIVQTLSKNHYVGDIKIDLNSKKETDTYELHEIRDELERELNPNPMRSFIDDHKSKMNDIQIREQAKMGMAASLDSIIHQDVKKYKTSASCISCHQAQGQFWQGTPHSIAYLSLIKANEANNLSCIGCHSLGLNDPKGFSTQKNMVTFKNKSALSYWKEINSMALKIDSVRKLPANEIKEHSVKWLALDKKHGVNANFANVQCLNCHTQADTHPMKKSEVAQTAQIKNKCLSCHTPDQSPEWYESGIKVNTKFEESFKKVSCPKI